MSGSFSYLTDQLRQFRDERNWSAFHTPKDLAISVSVEAAELLEIFQWRNDSIGVMDPNLSAAVGSEAADVFLYLLLLCDKLNIDLLAASEEKIRLNKKRFPVETARDVAKPEDQTKK